MTPKAVQRRVNEEALALPCDECGAKAGTRCRIVTYRPARPGYVAGTKVDVRPNVCQGRADAGWRAMMAAGLTA
jgi:hypothetical protein